MDWKTRLVQSLSSCVFSALAVCAAAVLVFSFTGCATTDSSQYSGDSSLPWGGPDDLGGRGPAADMGGGMMGAGLPY
jgi:hypothetical protein